MSGENIRVSQNRRETWTGSILNWDNAEICEGRITQQQSYCIMNVSEKMKR